MPIASLVASLTLPRHCSLLVSLSMWRGIASRSASWMALKRSELKWSGMSSTGLASDRAF